MIRLPTAALCLALAAGPAAAQQPAHEAAPPGVPSPTGPDGVIDCVQLRPSFNVTLPTGDIRCTGVAAVEYPTASGTVRKWFVSRANGGLTGQVNQQVSIFDGDATNNPIATSHRSIRRSLAYLGGLWGHRDGEGYTYLDTVSGQTRSVVFFGDEGQQVQVLDARTETWIGNLMLTGYGTAGSTTTIRALAARPANSGVADQNVRLYVSDWNNTIEEWAVDLNTMTPTLVSAGIPNPGSLYGMTCFPRGSNWYLATFGQQQMSCTGVGLIRLSILDLSRANTPVVWQRSADPNIPGEAPNFQGGLAGGLQYVVLDGQPCLAALQQTVSDAIGFLPLGGYGLRGPADCGSEVLTVLGAPTSGSTTGFAVHGAVPSRLYFALMGFAPAANFSFGLVGYNPACFTDVGPPIPVTVLMPLVSNGRTILPVPIPPWFTADLIMDTAVFDTVTLALSSTNRVELRVRPPPF